ncbi:MAG: signal peptidase II [Pseudomonadota bacterium]
MKFDGKKYFTVACIATLVIFLDQVTKYYICKLVPLYSRIEVLKGCLDIIHIRNSGIAFGLLKGFGSQYKTPALFLVGAVALFLLLFLVSQIKKEHALQRFSLSLILGGAIGNLIDRVRMGEVVDFIDAHWNNVYHWPAFNFADAGISVGIMLMLFDEIFRKREKINIQREGQ